MTVSKWERKAADLNRQLENEKREHAKTTRVLQAEVVRWQRLARPKILDLMGVYPALKKLLNVLAEAADLQDPARGAPIEDTMRTEFIANGERASTSATEAGVLVHYQARANVRLIGKELGILRDRFNRDLDEKTHWLAKLVGGEEYQYELPEPPVCHRKGCPHRGRRQSYSAWWEGCSGCGRMFEMEQTG